MQDPGARTYREMTGADLHDPDYRTFDQKSWKRSVHENLRPFRHWVFLTEGGKAALQVIDGWAQTVLVRRESGDESATYKGFHGLAVTQGFSLPSAALHAISVDAWLKAEKPWVRSLFELVFVDGWKPQCSIAAYFLPEATAEAEARSWQALIEECEGWGLQAEAKDGFDARQQEFTAAPGASSLNFDLPYSSPEFGGAKEVIANAYKELERLLSEQVVVVGVDAPAPPRGIGPEFLHLRRWTFDLSAFGAKAVDMEEGKRTAWVQRELAFAVLRLAVTLRLGETTPKVALSDAWDEALATPEPDALDEALSGMNSAVPG